MRIGCGSTMARTLCASPAATCRHGCPRSGRRSRSRLTPTPQLAELLDAIRRGGQEAYRRLLGVLRELKSLEAGSELYRRALAELARAQGVVLGNVGVFVDASVDPETLTH